MALSPELKEINLGKLDRLREKYADSGVSDTGGGANLLTPIKSFASEIEMAIPNVAGGLATLGQIQLDVEFDDKGRDISKGFIRQKPTKALTAIKEWSKEYAPLIQLSDKERESFLLSSIPGAFGSAVKFMGYALTGAGLPLMATDIFGSTYNDISKSNPEWSENKRIGFAIAHAIPEALLERWGTQQILNPFLKIGTTTPRQILTKGTLFKNFSNAVKNNFLSEAGQETSQQLANNAIDKLYKIDRGILDGVLESFFVGGIVGGTFGGISSSIHNQTINKRRNELKSLGFTDSEMTQITSSLGDLMDKEIQNDPVAVAEVLDVFKSMGEGIRTEGNLKSKIKDKLITKGMTEEDATESLKNMNLGQVMGLTDMVKKQETAETLEQYSQAIKVMETQALEAYGTKIDPNVIHESLMLHDVMVESFAEIKGVTKYDIIKEMNIEIVKGETFDEKIKTINDKVKETVSDAVAMPDSEREDVTIKASLGSYINKEVIYNGEIGRLVQSENGDILVETGTQTYDLGTQLLDQDPGDVGVRVENVPEFRLNKDTIEIGDRKMRIKDIKESVAGKLSLEVEENGKDKTFGNQKIILDIDIARNKNALQAEYRDQENTEKHDTLAQDNTLSELIKGKGIDNAMLLESIISRYYTPKMEGILGALERGFEVSERNLVFVMDKTIATIEEVERRKLPTKEANILRKILYAQMEVIDNEFSKQGKISVTEQGGAGESFKAFSQRVKNTEAIFLAREKVEKDLEDKKKFEEALKYDSAEEFVKEQTKEIRVQYFKKIQKEQEKLFNEFDMSGTPQEKLKKINLRDKATEKLTKKIYSELEEKIKQQTQQLTDIYNKAHSLKQEGDALIEEARNKIIEEIENRRSRELGYIENNGYFSDKKTSSELGSVTSYNQEYYKEKDKQYFIDQQNLRAELINDMRHNPKLVEKNINMSEEEVMAEFNRRGIEFDTEEELYDYMEYFYTKASRFMSEPESLGENLRGKVNGIPFFIVGEDTYEANVNGNIITGQLEDMKEKINSALKLEPKTDIIEAQLKKVKDAKNEMQREIDAIEESFNPQQEAKEKLFDTTQEGQNFELFQKKNMTIQGSFLPMDGKNYIKIYETADASTLIHELSHSWLHWYSKNATNKMGDLMRWAGIKNINNPEQYKTLQEKFANAFVDNYLYEGKAPNAELQDTFNNFKEWLGVVFKNVQRNKIKMNKNVTDFFDTMLKKETKEFTDPSNMEEAEAELQELYQARKELKDRIIRAGKSHKGDVKAYVKAEIKEIQEKLIKYIEGIEGMDTKERGIFIKNIKNANSEKTLSRQIDIVTDKAENFIEAKKKRIINRLIDREYKMKPIVKQGAVSKGKYDYETNKLVLELREYNRLNMESANVVFNRLLEDIGTREPSNAEKIKLRLLGLRSRGLINSSSQSMAMVLGDIKYIKDIGKTTKSLEEMEKKIEKHESAVELIDQLQKNEVSRNALTRKAETIYARGFGNVYSFFNTIFGKDIAEKYNTEILETRRDVAIDKSIKRIIEGAYEPLGLKNKMEYDRWLSETSKKEFKLTDKDKKTEDISKQQIIHIYLGMKNDNVAYSYNYHFGQDQIQELLDNLTDGEMAYADNMQEVIRSYYPSLNAVHVRTTGLDLNVIQNYFPMTSEYELNIVDDIKRQGQFISSEKERKSFTKPKPSNATSLALGSINDIEHRIKLSERYVEMKKLINSNEVIQVGDEGYTVKSYITKLYGENAFGTLNNIVDSISNENTRKDSEIISDAFGKVINNWTIAKIAMSPTVFAKQLISVSNYMENMPITDWHAGFIEALAHPKKTWDYMMEISPYLEHRFGQGYNKELQLLMSESAKGSILDGNYVKLLTSFTRYGDIFAIIYGGYPYMKYLQSQGYTQEQAEEMFVQATKRSQQSPDKSSLSVFQQRASQNPFVRAYTVFKNTPTQYFRKQVDSAVQLSKGEITLQQFAKTQFIYTVLQPSLYAMVGLGMKGLLYGDDWDAEKWMHELMMSLVVSPFGAIPIVSDFIRAGYQRASGKKVWQIFNQGALGDVEKFGKALLDGEITGKDVITALTIGTEVTTKFPAVQIEKLINKNIERFTE